MATVLQPNERLVLAGVLGVRAPDGSIARNVKLYEIVTEDEVRAETGLTSREEEACKETVKFMAAQFGEYVRGVQAMERRGKVVNKRD